MTLFLRHSTGVIPLSMLLNKSEAQSSLPKGQKSPCSTHPQGHCHLLLTECHCVTGMLNIPVWFHFNVCLIHSSSPALMSPKVTPVSQFALFCCCLINAMINFGHALCSPLAWHDATWNIINCELHSPNCPVFKHDIHCTASGSQGILLSYK